MTSLRPSLKEFRRLTEDGNLIPVVTELISDVETPVGAFAKIGPGGFSFLFESAERNEESGRFSFIGIDPLLVISSRGSELTIWEKTAGITKCAVANPLEQLQSVLAEFRFLSRNDIPHFQGGAVGFVGYDVVRFFEPKTTIHLRDDLALPEMVFMIAGTLIVFDHRFRMIRLIALADLRKQKADAAYEEAAKGIERVLAQLSRPSPLKPIAASSAPTVTGLTSNTNDFEQMVVRAKRYISDGDIFQVVLSQRFQSDFSADPLDLYRCLRFGNPSPYMFFLNFGTEFCALGSSPELHVRVHERTVQIRPIAGTRPRGNDGATDEANARDLLTDPKERAEHVMLIDLARNDVGRIARFGSVRVTEQMAIERYSHVMHIVSQVQAQLRDGLNAFDVFRATFPAGTVSGAPKIRAMQIISELEKSRRGFYAGVVGWFGFDGNCDSCIALRSVVLKNGKAFVQAGAGIVADSEPAREREETERKAMAVLAAIEQAKCCC
ncbi:MAG: anthranilate synthase component I [Verrucomicrobia bacterium]|nr:MAG: anthranilate synthase component I [Verrucomicrobiota bacterium]